MIRFSIIFLGVLLVGISAFSSQLDCEVNEVRGGKWQVVKYSLPSLTLNQPCSAGVGCFTGSAKHSSKTFSGLEYSLFAMNNGTVFLGILDSFGDLGDPNIKKKSSMSTSHRSQNGTANLSLDGYWNQSGSLQKSSASIDCILR